MHCQVSNFQLDVVKGQAECGVAAGAEPLAKSANANAAGMFDRKGAERPGSLERKGLQVVRVSEIQFTGIFQLYAIGKHTKQVFRPQCLPLQ
jgi:hypothetical protein